MIDLGKKIDIKAKKMNFLSKSRKFRFSDEVLVKGDLFEMSCDSLEGFYDQKGALANIICQGKVKLAQEFRKVFGEKASYDLTQDKVQFFGKCRVEQKEGELEGYDAELFIEKDEMKIKDVKMRLNREGINRVVKD